MKTKILFVLLTLLLPVSQTVPLLAATPLSGAAIIVQQSKSAVAPLRNEDVSELLKAKVSPEVVIAKIKSSTCDFDTSSAALQKLKTEGVPDEVILAMVMRSDRKLTNAPSADSTSPREESVIRIPAGTPVEIETAYTVDSELVKAGDVVSFRVVNAVKVSGVIVIAAGAPATARVIRAKRGGRWGRAGHLAWEMQDATTIDDKRIPLQFAKQQKGVSKGGTVATATVATVATATVMTGVLLWPIAPVALLWGFKRGKNAVIPAGKRFDASVREDPAVNSVISR